MTAYQRARAAGWTIERGSYHGTHQDRADRWYADHESASLRDRSGPGFATRTEAAEAALEVSREHGDAP